MTTRPGKLELSLRGDCEIVFTRVFNAPRQLVFDAFTKPELVRRWLGGLEGWTMPVCDIDLRAGGTYRYLWRKEEGFEMGMGGVFLEIAPPDRLVSTEKFDQAWYPGEGVSTVEFTEADGQTTLTQTVRYESKEARDVVLQSPMEEGVALSYNRLEDLVAAL
jgi:uncharacterized protein YndB with AHSA1/START domain